MQKENLEKLLQKKAAKSGRLSMDSEEKLESYHVVFRPFKKVTLNITGKRVDDLQQRFSLIDAELAPLVLDDDHRILLWRPRHANCKTSTDESITQPEIDSAPVQSLIDEMMEKRWQAQEHDEEMRPKLRRLQVDPLSTLSILLPRTPGGLRKEQVLIDDRKASHAYIFATSLITNCTSRNIITSADIGETILVETIIANYRAEDESTRILALETPGTRSFNDAIKAGKALTRLCQLYVECREVVSNTPK